MVREAPQRSHQKKRTPDVHISLHAQSQLLLCRQVRDQAQLTGQTPARSGTCRRRCHTRSRAGESRLHVLLTHVQEQLHDPRV